MHFPSGDLGLLRRLAAGEPRENWKKRAEAWPPCGVTQRCTWGEARGKGQAEEIGGSSEKQGRLLQVLCFAPKLFCSVTG